jgi:major inositol transporter-like SP family MFS transporter
MSEIFPTRLRGIFMGAVFSMWIANFLISLFFPILLAWLGLSGTFFIFAGIGVFGAIFVIKCVPETRHRSLEQIEHYLRDKLDTSEEGQAARARRIVAESQADKV